MSGESGTGKGDKKVGGSNFGTSSAGGCVSLYSLEVVKDGAGINADTGTEAGVEDVKLPHKAAIDGRRAGPFDPTIVLAEIVHGILKLKLPSGTTGKAIPVEVCTLRSIALVACMMTKVF
jgi:hypothetical protein